MLPGVSEMTVVIAGLDCELYDGVRETTQTTGTGTYQLDGAAVVSGHTYRTFVSVAVGQRVPYVVWFGAAFERGLGIVTAGAPPTITRGLILESSNSDNAVSWGAGVKDIWLDAPSELLGQIVAPVFIASTKVTLRSTTGSFVKDAKSLEMDVHCVGGGGGGGGAQISGAGAAAEGSGGGSGGYSFVRLTSSGVASSVTVTIGPAGAGGAGALSGGDGGNTTFGAHCRADGGFGGIVGLATSGNTAEAGGAGGQTGSAIGNIIMAGGYGGSSRVIASQIGTSQWIGANHGGDAPGPFGGRGGAGASTGAGRTGRNYGSGGQGAHSVASAAATGGDGAGGVCVIIERLSA